MSPSESDGMYDTELSSGSNLGAGFPAPAPCIKLAPMVMLAAVLTAVMELGPCAHIPVADEGP
jgi:hypothetical protein